MDSKAFHGPGGQGGCAGEVELLLGYSWLTLAYGVLEKEISFVRNGTTMRIGVMVLRASGVFFCSLLLQYYCTLVLGASGAQRLSGENAPAATIKENKQNRKSSPPSGSLSSSPPGPIGPEWKTLAQQIHQTLQTARDLPVHIQTYTPAELMQWALVWGCDAEAAYGSLRGQRVNVLAILCHNYPCADRHLLVEHQGHFAARFGYGYQSYRGEFLALLAWARVPKDYPLQLQGQKRTVADLVEYEKLQCRSGQEQSHVLIGLSFYLDGPEQTSWQNRLGEAWSMERLISEELQSPILGAADGGVHRLFALSYALQARRKYQLPWTPLFDQLEQYLARWQKYALSRQREDGTWGPGFFSPQAEGGQREGRLRSTGMIFRWLAFSLPEDQLYSKQMFNTSQTLLSLLQKETLSYPKSRSPRDFSSLMYTLDGLRLYYQRALAPLEHQAQPQMASGKIGRSEDPFSQSEPPAKKNFPSTPSPLKFRNPPGCQMQAKAPSRASSLLHK